MQHLSNNNWIKSNFNRKLKNIEKRIFIHPFYRLSSSLLILLLSSSFSAYCHSTISRNFHVVTKLLIVQSLFIAKPLNTVICSVLFYCERTRIINNKQRNKMKMFLFFSLFTDLSITLAHLTWFLASEMQKKDAIGKYEKFASGFMCFRL